MEKNVRPGGVFYNQKNLNPTGLCPDHLPFKPLSARREVPRDLVQACFTLNDNFILKSVAVQHGGVIAGFQGAGLVADTVFVQPCSHVPIHLFSAVTHHCKAL